jgi:spermidine/putrescine transport system ATP-binding protein
MQLELKRIQSEVGITFIYVTHDQEEAMTMSDRIAVMRAGKIEQLGDPESLYERPLTAFVAGFLGVSNLLEGEVSGHEGGMVAIRLNDGTFIRAPAPDGGGSLHEVRLGVRPEKLRVLPVTDGQATDEATNMMEGVVLDSSYLGVSTQYLVETRDGHKITAYAQNLETAGQAEALADGEKVRLTWQPRHTFVVAGSAEHVAGDPHAPEEEGDLDV